jgi:hypothetical protein
MKSRKRFALLCVAAVCLSATEFAIADRTTTEASDKFGQGGTLEQEFSPSGPVIHEIWRDKCGRIREETFEGGSPHRYFSPEGDGTITDRNGEYSYESTQHSNVNKLHPDNAHELIEAWKKAKIPPCPEKQQKTTDHPEKPKEQPNPLGKLLQNVNIGIGVSGGHPVGHHDDHKGDHRISDHKRTSSTSSSKKTVTAGCKCHPCTCSPCKCH